jgi:hypothetical protein
LPGQALPVVDRGRHCGEQARCSRRRRRSFSLLRNTNSAASAGAQAMAGHQVPSNRPQTGFGVCGPLQFLLSKVNYRFATSWSKLSFRYISKHFRGHTKQSTQISGRETCNTSAVFPATNLGERAGHNKTKTKRSDRSAIMSRARNESSNPGPEQNPGRVDNPERLMVGAKSGTLRAFGTL